MVGGMNKRGDGIPMAERVRLGKTDDCPARHCWVADPADRSGVKRPGLLLEWRQTAGVWEGRVVYAASVRERRWAAVEEWIASELLSASS
jgi:hypothetical protein